MKYAAFNQDGSFLHILIAGLHDIPESAVAVSSAQERRLLNEQDGIWKLVNGEIVKAPLPVLPEPEPTTPQSVTPAQGLMALYTLKAITEDDILASIGTIEDATLRYQALIAYKKATSWDRPSVTMQTLAGLLALTEPDLDELFTKAATYANL